MGIKKFLFSEEMSIGHYFPRREIKRIPIYERLSSTGKIVDKNNRIVVFNKGTAEIIK